MKEHEPMIDIDGLLEKLEGMNLSKDLEEFIIEGNFLLNQLEVSSLKINTLEKGSEDYNECYAHIVKDLKTIKGGSKIHGLDKITSISEFVENLVNNKKDDGEFSKEFIHYILKSANHLKYMLVKDSPPEDLELYDPDANDENRNKERKEMDASKDNATMAFHNSEEYNKFLEGKLERIDMDKVWATHLEGSQKIIIIDDEPDVLSLLTMNVEENFPDAKISAFPTAHEALKDILKINPDLIITDYNLPEMNGCEFASKVTDKFPNLPVILISGYLDKDIVLSSLSSGASGVIEKPFTAEELTQLIKVNLIKYQEFKQFKSAISCLLYQFSDLEEVLRKKGELDILKSLRKEIDNLYSYKKFLGTSES